MPPGLIGRADQESTHMTRVRLRRLGVIRYSAGQLASEHNVAMTLDDGGGIGWVLCGELHVESVGRIAFESDWDPDNRMTQVHGPADAPADALTRVLAALGLTSDDLLQIFDLAISQEVRLHATVVAANSPPRSEQRLPPLRRPVQYRHVRSVVPAPERAATPPEVGGIFTAQSRATQTWHRVLRRSCSTPRSHTTQCIAPSAETSMCGRAASSEKP